MKIHQLSIFLENRPGQLTPHFRLLADAGINVKTVSLADTEQFGILHMVVSDWARAREVLQAAGCVVNVTEVAAVEVPDRPGGLRQVLEIIEGAGLNIEYMYAFTFASGDCAVLIFRFDNLDEAIRLLTQNGIKVLDDVDLQQSCTA